MFKKKTNKIVMYSLIGLATVSLAAVGFSSWIIDGSVDSSNNNVTVNVSNAQDRTTLIELGTCDTNLSFDYKKSSTNPNPNIIFDEKETKDEDLEFSLVYTIKSNSSLKYGKHRISISFDKATKTTYSTLNATNKYIDYSCLTDFSFILGEAGNNIQTETTGLKNITNKLEYNDATGFTSATVTSTFTFAWGEYFNGKNPCEYGNGVGEKDESDYKEKLTKFSEDVQNKTFNINVTIASSYVTGN